MGHNDKTVQLEDFSKDKGMEVLQRGPIRTFQKTIPVRGCKLGLEDVKVAYRELSHINQKFGQEEIARIKRREANPGMTSK